MKSKRSRKDKARRRSNLWTFVHAKNKKNQIDLDLLIRELFETYENSEVENKKAFDECPTIGIFKVRKGFNTHESVEL